MEEDDFTLQPRSTLGKRAKRTLRKSQRWSLDDMFDHVHKPQLQKSWEKARDEDRYNYRRKAYQHLELIHLVLVQLPQDMIYKIQEMAGMQVQAMPLPKIIRTRSVSNAT